MANIKISELNPLLTVEDADVLPIVDNAVTKKVTAAILRSYTQGNSVLLTGAQTVAGIKTFTSQLASTVATGTAPFSVASTTKVTNLNADLLDGLSSADFQATLSGTGIVKSTAGTISYLTDNTANWDTAYNDKINSAAVTGSGTNTLTLTQQDAGTITATWVNGTLIREVRNTTGATLTKGTIVYISGATGNKPTVTKAIATGDSTSAQTFGFIQSDLANNDNGYVVVVGDLTGVDTSAFAEGAQLYLSSTVAGTFTSTKQYAPAHLVYVGIVTRSHPTLGQIEVNIQNGYELDELHNVAAQNPSNGDILQYVTSTGLWTKVAGTTTNISEGTNLYFTNARSRSAFSESVTGLDYNSTTGVLSTTSGYGIPTTASQATWDTAYNDSIVSAAVTGTTTKTLTLNQQDGGTVTASWTDDNTDAVSSVFGRTGAVVAASGDYTTTQVTEGTNLYFTDARARAAISLTTTGTSGAATYSGGVLNIPQYQAALTNPITGTGTTNYLPKFTGTSALGNSVIYDDGTNVTIGGANSFGWKTFINSGANASNLLLGSSTTGVVLAFNDATCTVAPRITGVVNDLLFTTNSTERMRITSSGNVGIGTASPSAKLEVKGGQAASKDLLFSLSKVDYGVTSFYQNYSNTFYTNGKSLEIEVEGLPLLQLAVNNAGSASKVIFPNGNVGIGTTTDAGYKLDVNGTARVNGSFYIANANANNELTFAGTEFTNIYSETTLGIQFGITSTGNSAGIDFLTNNTTRLTIASTGAATFSSSVTATRGIFGGSTGETLTAQGVAGEWTTHITGAASTGNSYGLVVNAGTNASDLALGIYNQAFNSTLFTIKGDGAATFSSSVTVGTGLSLSGSTAPASGIQFPATQVASASANNLDDYEEGTFTPTFTGSTTNPTVTYAVQSGIYTKIGRQVTCSIEIGTTANTGGVGAIRVSGLPFTIGIRSYMSVATYNIDNSAATPLGIFAEIGSGNTRFDLLQTADNGNWSTMNWTQATNAEVYVNATITYFV